MVLGQIVYRSLTEERGLTETTVPFQSLEELFDLVTNAKPPLLIDRIAIRGQEDGSKKERIVNFVFRSIQLVEKK